MARLNYCCLLVAAVLAFGARLEADESKQATESKQVDERLAVPSASELRDAGEALTRKFAGKQSKNPGDQDQADLADALVAFAEEQDADPVVRYAALERAYDIGVEIGFPILIARVAKKMASTYQVEAATLIAGGYARALEIKRSPSAYRDIAREAVFEAHGLAARENFRQAKRLAELAQSAAAKSKSKRIQQNADAADAVMAGCCRLFAQFNDARATLANQPDDPAANLAIGNYLSFVKQDWKQGLPALAKGSDAGLAALAKRTMELEPGSTSRLEVADQWWTFAAKAEPSQKIAMESMAIALDYGALHGMQPAEAERMVALVRDWCAQNPGNTIVAAIYSGALDPPKVAEGPPRTPTNETAPKGPPKRTAGKPSSTRLEDYPPLDSSLADYVRRAIQSGQTADSPRSGSGGTEFRDVPPEGALLLAIVVHWKGEFEKACGVQPVYLTTKGAHFGPLFGTRSQRNGISLARVGYAVGGLKIPTGAVLEGTEVVMMRVQGNKLDPANWHSFRTRSGPPRGSRESAVVLDGSLVIGVAGSVDSEGQLVSFGLVTVK